MAASKYTGICAIELGVYCSQPAYLTRGGMIAQGFGFTRDFTLKGTEV